MACFLLGITLLASCRSHEKEDKILRIATAANMQFAMEKLTEAFSQENGIACEVILSSSGKLFAQIKEGAPYDVFVSADLKYPEQLYRDGYSTSPPTVYANGQIVLWTMNEATFPSIEILTNDAVRHIALPSPKTAPYGMAALEVLNNHNIFTVVEDKLVYGESVAQTNQFIISRSAEFGFTAMSVVLSPEMKGKGKWIALDQKEYTPIKQAVVLVKNKNGVKPGALKFHDFLLSTKGRTILQKFGYWIDE